MTDEERHALLWDRRPGFHLGAWIVTVAVVTWFTATGLLPLAVALRLVWTP